MKNALFLCSTALRTHPNATKWRPGRLGVKFRKLPRSPDLRCSSCGAHGLWYSYLKSTISQSMLGIELPAIITSLRVHTSNLQVLSQSVFLFSFFLTQMNQNCINSLRRATNTKRPRTAGAKEEPK
jgi:hypothetical protein